MLARADLKKGPSTPIVFLHGILGSSADWEPVCSFLPPCPCIAFDLPGHGKSPFAETIDIPLEKFHLVGYSLGGRLALAYAASHPEKIASLTILSAHPGLTSEEEKTKRIAHDAKWAELLFELSIDDFLDRWYEQPVFKPYKPDLTLRRQQNIPGLASAFVHFSLGRQPRYDTSNALILVGERDEKFRKLYENPIVIPNAGHMAHLENPKAVAIELMKAGRTPA